ncbi:MAG TPA: hypothetical protein PL124_02065 [Candidatus Cloacimonadota bacterium]|nr:hypothetical protein [Candidatus Cloacimonadota bacterium]HPS38179.1 hypothetical protein [Candidatus Cloacimonadota bacterium]
MKFTLIFVFIISFLPLLAQEQEFYAADQSVFVLPTAYTMPAGTFAFTDYEVALLQFAYAPVDRLHLSYGMVFPVTKDMFRTASLGFKYQYYSTERLATALWTSYSPDPKLLTVGNIFSGGNGRTSAHLGIGALVSMDEGVTATAIGAGIIHGLTPRVSGMLELDTTFINNDTELFDSEDSVRADCFLLAGVRLKGEKVSWDFGAMRQLTEDWGDLIALPFIKATVLF